MTDPNVTALARRIAELERRLRGVERSARLERSSVVVDASGTSLDVRTALVESNLVSLNLAVAIQQLVSIAAGSVGTLSVFFSDLLPVGSPGSLWYNRATTELRQFLSGAWVLSSRQDLAPVFAASDIAVQTADGLIFTWWQPTPPPGGNFGDLWFKTDTNNAPHRWDDSQGWAPLLTAQIQSANYVPGEAGFGFTPDGGGQVQTLQATEQIGTPLLYADDVSLAGRSLVSRLADKPEGVVKLVYAGGTSGAQNAGPVSSTELRLFELNLGPLIGGHTDRTTLSGHFQRSIADDGFDFRLRYTTDGSEALVTSPIFPGGLHRIVFPQNSDFDFWTDIEPLVTANYRVALTLQRAVGTGTGSVYANPDGTRRFRWITEDLGLTEGALDTAALSQKLKADGSGADNPPVATYTKTFSPTWIQAYDHNGNQVPAGSNGTAANMWQGMDLQNEEIDHGVASNRRFTLIGFNSSQIQAALATATSYVSCRLSWKPKVRSSASTGLDTKLLTHKYASVPTAYAEYWDNDPNITLYGGVGVNNTAPGTVYSADYGTGVAAAFKAGTWKGCGLWAPDNTSAGYGYGYGWGSGSSLPVLTIVYKGTS